jgi:hypothetical protein
MAFPGITTGKNLVVASVQSSPNIAPNFQESSEVPTSRPNGGTLLIGDTWWDPTKEEFYVYNGTEWIIIGSPTIDAGNANSYQ